MDYCVVSLQSGKVSIRPVKRSWSPREESIPGRIYIQQRWLTRRRWSCDPCRLTGVTVGDILRRRHVSFLLMLPEYVFLLQSSPTRSIKKRRAPRYMSYNMLAPWLPLISLNKIVHSVIERKKLLLNCPHSNLVELVLEPFSYIILP